MGGWVHCIVGDVVTTLVSLKIPGWMGILHCGRCCYHISFTQNTWVDGYIASREMLLPHYFHSKYPGGWVHCIVGDVVILGKFFIKLFGFICFWEFS